MTTEDRDTKRREYLAKAQYAEQQALRSRDDASRESWANMALQYRRMADDLSAGE